MISHLATRLNRLEQSRGPKDACSMCHDAGIWVTRYEDNPEPAPGNCGCPECGRYNGVTIRYVAPPLPLPTGGQHP